MHRLSASSIPLGKNAWFSTGRAVARVEIDGAYSLPVISRVAALASACLVVLSLLVVWRLAVSPDSDWVVGLLVVAPFLAIAVGLGLLAWWSRTSAQRH